jgi:hypothetical protein
LECGYVFVVVVVIVVIVVVVAAAAAADTVVVDALLVQISPCLSFGHILIDHVSYLDNWFIFKFLQQLTSDKSHLSDVQS